MAFNRHNGIMAFSKMAFFIITFLYIDRYIDRERGR